jgi:hypothetical protein
MRPRLSFGVIVLLLATCFALGLVSALLGRTPEEEPAPTPLATPDEDESQVDVLILGFDRAGGEPALRAIWIASFEPPGRELFLTGIPSDAPSPALDSRAISTAFAIGAGGAPSAEFLDALVSIAALTPDLVIALDDRGFQEIVDYLGGVDLNNAALDGAQILAVLDLLADDPAASTATQRSVLQAMVRSAEPLGDSPDITPLAALVPDHAYLSLPMTQAIALAAPLLPLDPEAVHFDVFGHSPADPSD